MWGQEEDFLKIKSARASSNTIGNNPVGTEREMMRKEREGERREIYIYILKKRSP